MSRRRTGAPLDHTTSTVRASGLAVCGESAARRTRSSGIGALHCGLVRRDGGVERKTKPRLARAIGSNRRVHLLDVVTAFGDRLAAAFEAGADLLDLGARILARIDPLPFWRQPIAGEVWRRIAVEIA